RIAITIDGPTMKASELPSTPLASLVGGHPCKAKCKPLLPIPGPNAKMIVPATTTTQLRSRILLCQTLTASFPLVVTFLASVAVAIWHLPAPPRYSDWTSPARLLLRPTRIRPPNEIDNCLPHFRWLDRVALPIDDLA